ncbi:NAD(+)/NADH kinase [Candidatus Poriferisodalis sp.]|uniref:NAD(+)/NADH kinase n=1 Tax=Candidatus Poriferisodalis sp. TaxID=3101277 RepID=UPI003B01B279
MSAVLVVAHAERSEALSASKGLVDWLSDEGHAVEMGRSEAVAIGRSDLIAAEPIRTALDLAVSVGGDGTMLRSFDLVAAAGVPVLGVNVGHLGYLTEFEPAELIDVVASALAGSLGISERMMVAATVCRASGAEPDDPDEGAVWTGLNEVVLEKRDTGHTVRLEVRLDGDMFATYAADGIIVSTPTGSTAYSLSAGGAVVAPTHSSLQVTPVAPHMLFDRSLLLGADTEIGIRVISERPALAAVDGRSATMLQTGDELVVTRAACTARFVTAGGDSFHRVLKHKFGLKDR